MKKNKIHSIVPDSIADEVGINSGDYLLRINGEEVLDIFDYRFLCTDENILVEIESRKDGIIEFDIEKEENEDLGLVFENELIESPKSCSNNCIFCFIDQLPKGMRKTMYFKDDDSRLSFLTGNYVTLTNVSYQDIERIIKYRMSPINVSVHAVDPIIRAKMLNNQKAIDVIEKIKMFTKAGLEVNCQIVLCPNINDGKELDNSLETLGNINPPIKSISVVPVGLTKHRQKLFELKQYDKEKSLTVINQISKWQKIFLEKQGTRVVYLADEFFVMANYPIPRYFEYEDFPQIENGVGLIASFVHEVNSFIANCDSKYFDIGLDTISIATGTLFFNTLISITDMLQKKAASVKINVYPITNEFFGKTVTVTGLLTGQDIISQLKQKPLGSRLLISKSVLKANTQIFLDDYTVSDIERELNIKVQIVENNGEDFIRNVLNKHLESR